jgi:hypothetical protein
MISNYEAPHCATSSILQLLHLLMSKYLLGKMFSDTLSLCQLHLPKFEKDSLVPVSINAVIGSGPVLFPATVPRETAV